MSEHHYSLDTAISVGLFILIVAAAILSVLA